MATDGLLSQLRRMGGELIVADSSGLPAPAEMLDDPIVVWLERPGEWLFRLRREGYDIARGEIVAMTEDHCVVADDWVERILAAHADAPGAYVVLGAVDNGSTERLTDWALFFVAHLPISSPLPARPRVTGHTNLSYKRKALSAMPHDGGQLVEIIYNQHLRSLGHMIVGDDRLRVSHHQSASLARYMRLQYDNGRAIAGLRRQEMGAADWLRGALPLGLVLYRVARTIFVGRGKDVPQFKLLAALPMVTLMQLAHALGETIGYLAGPGDSPARLH